MLRVREEANAPAAQGGIIENHTTDLDCQAHLDPDGECLVCHVVAGEPCLHCGRQSFHADHCPEADWVADVVQVP